MKKYIMLNIILLVNASSLFGTSWDTQQTQKAAKNFIYNCPYKKSTHAFILSYPLCFVNGKKGAARYVEYISFYSTKPQGKFNSDTAIDLLVFPLVDNVVGRIMTPIKGLAYVRGATQHVSPHVTNFLVDNAQLITSAAITKAINVSVEKGSPTRINRDDVEKFGTACFIQVSCDAVDEAVIKPLVQMTVGDDSSLIGWAVHAGMNMAFVNLFTSMVVKK